tara:strand:+ start:1919 stop:2455 length:537 start_codon:yes stop_codon:yes gene_type:complete
MIEKININKIFTNAKNPRIIKDYKFKKLVKSIKEFPEMLQLRPIVVDNNNKILGGNMRYKACQELDLKEVYIIKAKNLNEKEIEQFIIKDNVGFGEWDWDILANQWDNEILSDWGVDNFDFYDKEYNSQEINIDDLDDSMVLKLNYTEEKYNYVKENLKKIDIDIEKALLQLLNYEEI